MVVSVPPAPRPGAGGSARGITKPHFSPGAPVQYYSRSANNWIDAVVEKFVPPDSSNTSGYYKLDVHDNAPPDRVRKKPVGVAANMNSRKAGPPISKPGNVQHSPRNVARPTNNSNINRSNVRSGITGNSPSRAGIGGRDKFSSTINPMKICPGDRVQITQSGREGTAMWVGHPSCNRSKNMVGIRLDIKRTSDDCDGKFANERFFRCEPGYAIFLETNEVSVISKGNVNDGINGCSDNDAQQVSPSCLTVATSPNWNLSKVLDGLVGQVAAKKTICSVRNMVDVGRKRANLGVAPLKPVHFTMSAEPGLGRNEICKVLAQLLVNVECLGSGQVIRISRQELVSVAMAAQSVSKRVEELWKAAAGGILLITDAHNFAPSDKRSSREDEGGNEVLASLCKLMDADASSTGKTPSQTVSVVLCGERGTALQQLLRDKPALGAHFGGDQFRLSLEDFTADDLAAILRKLVESQQFVLNIPDERLAGMVKRAESSSPLKHTRFLSSFLESAIARQATRVYEMGTVSRKGLCTLLEGDFSDESSDAAREARIDSVLQNLNDIIGLQPVKDFVHSLRAQLQTEAMRRREGLPRTSQTTLHMVFTGTPGTGKTTVARIIGQLLAAMGILKEGQLIEADRSGLVAGYSGQTALKTKAVVESALGGVLFIDEAYALVQQSDGGGRDAFGREALDTLLKLAEDHRDDVIIILAGYPKEMQQLLDTNPGIRSRWPTVLDFPDYSKDEMVKIAKGMLDNECMTLSDKAKSKLADILKEMCTKPHANGRSVRNILDRARRKQAVRLQKIKKVSAEQLTRLEPADFDLLPDIKN